MLSARVIRPEPGIEPGLELFQLGLCRNRFLLIEDALLVSLLIFHRIVHNRRLSIQASFDQFQSCVSLGAILGTVFGRHIASLVGYGPRTKLGNVRDLHRNPRQKFLDELSNIPGRDPARPKASLDLSGLERFRHCLDQSVNGDFQFWLDGCQGARLFQLFGDVPGEVHITQSKSTFRGPQNPLAQLGKSFIHCDASEIRDHVNIDGPALVQAVEQRVSAVLDAFCGRHRAHRGFCEDQRFLC